MIIAAALFAVAAVLGAVLAVRTVQGSDRPLPIVLSHGAVAALGLVALIVVVLGNGAALAGWALVILAAAALGGFVLFGLDRSGRQLPVGMILGHGAVAVVGFVLLLAAIVGG